MPQLPHPAAVLFCADVARLTRFYTVVAEMRDVDGDDHHRVLESNGFQLIVHAIRGEPESAAVGDAIPAREDSYIKVCLPVASLAAARARAGTLGGRLQPVDREWQARGFRACDGVDPEGNVFQLREPAQ